MLLLGEPASRIPHLTQSRCRSCGSLSSADQSCAEKIEFRATIHLAFHELELGDLAFSLSVGPGFDECCGNRASVGPQAIHEGREQAGGSILKPGVQVCALPLTDHR